MNHARPSTTDKRPSRTSLPPRSVSPRFTGALARTRILLRDANEAFWCGHTALISRYYCSSLLQCCTQLPSESEVYQPCFVQTATNAISHAIATAVSKIATTSSRSCHLSLTCHLSFIGSLAGVPSRSACPPTRPRHQDRLSIDWLPRAACSKRPLSSLSMMTPLSTSTATMPMWPA